MPLFRENKESRVKNFVLKLVNNNCPEMRAMFDGPRRDSRVNLTIVVMVIPLEGEDLRIGEAFTAVTKEFSASGTAIVLDRQIGLDEVVLAFRFDGEKMFVRAKARHLSPIGGGFHQLGFEMIEVVSPGDYPKLLAVDF